MSDCKAETPATRRRGEEPARETARPARENATPITPRPARADAASAPTHRRETESGGMPPDCVGLSRPLPPVMEGVTAGTGAGAGTAVATAGGGDEEAKLMALMALGANFGKEMPEPLLEIWLDLLSPYPPLLVAEAVKTVIATYVYKTLPPFAALREALDDLAGVGGKSAALQATAEWSRLLEAIAGHGSYRAPARLHPTTAYVVGLLGGWKSVCAWREDDLAHKRRDFLHHWGECHGNVDVLALGAPGVAEALSRGTRRAALPSRPAASGCLGRLAAQGCKDRLAAPEYPSGCMDSPAGNGGDAAAPRGQTETRAESVEETGEPRGNASRPASGAAGTPRRATPTGPATRPPATGSGEKARRPAGASARGATPLPGHGLWRFSGQEAADPREGKNHGR